jgi:hypothetical protein
MKTTEQEAKMTLREVETELIRLSGELETENKRHTEAVKSYKQQIAEAERQKSMLLKGIDIEKIHTAEKVLWIRGLRDENNFDSDCVRRAIQGIASGDQKIKREYYGVKNYDQFYHQAEDYEYGYGPKHGTIVFSIGLRNPKHDLTDDDVECCLYLLNLLLDKDSRKAITGKDVANE